MNALGKILGLIDGNVDFGAIVGIFGRIAELVDEGQALAKEFRHDPRITNYVAKVRGLLKFDGTEISKEEIDAMRKHWGDLNDQKVHDLPRTP